MRAVTAFCITFLMMTCVSPFHGVAKEAAQVEKGQTIAFLGDSITDAGARPGGYCELVIRALNDRGLEVKPVYAGVGGHKCDQMLARLEKDVLSKKPDWMTLSCGVNDVWHSIHKRGIPLDEYKVKITEIIDRTQAAGIKVMILTSTMIKEDSGNELNKMLASYNAFLKTLAKEKNCLFADLNADMQAGLKEFPENAPKGKQLTTDGVHMNALGNYMMAKGVLRAFGVPAKDLKGVEDVWGDTPDTETIRVTVRFSANEMKQLTKHSLEAKTPLSVIFTDALKEKKAELLKN